MRTLTLVGILVIASVAIPVFSQDKSGRIFGTVTLQTGGVSVGAIVTLIDTATGTKQILMTDSAGKYDASLPPGNYTVHVEAKGFKVSQHTDVKVRAGRSVRINLVLRPGENVTPRTFTGVT